MVCAVDPRRLPALASLRARAPCRRSPRSCATSASQGDVPDLPHEVVLHGDPLLVVRTGGSAPEGGAAWTVLGRGRLAEDIVIALARRGMDVREQVRVRVDLSPRDLVETVRRVAVRGALAGPDHAAAPARHHDPGGQRVLRGRPRGARGRGAVRGAQRGSRRAGRREGLSGLSRRPARAARRRSRGSPWTGSACRSAARARRPSSSVSHSSVASAMPSARTAAGSPSCRATRSTTRRAARAPDSSAIRLIWARFVIGMIPGMIGMSTPSAASPVDEAEVVLGPEEQLGDREVRARPWPWRPAPGRRASSDSADGWPSGKAATPTQKSPSDLTSSTSSTA